MGDFGSKYSKIRTVKYRDHDPATGKKFNRHQENIAIVNHAVDEIIESEIDDNDLYEIDNMSLDKKKKINNDVSVSLKENSKKNI